MKVRQNVPTMRITRSGQPDKRVGGITYQQISRPGQPPFNYSLADPAQDLRL